jgi:hypothetical protein
VNRPAARAHRALRSAGAKVIVPARDHDMAATALKGLDGQLGQVDRVGVHDLDPGEATAEEPGEARVELDGEMAAPAAQAILDELSERPGAGP